MTDAQILRRIGLNIRQAREAAGLTQEGLAELIDIHPKTLGYIESGKRDFGVTHLARLFLLPRRVGQRPAGWPEDRYQEQRRLGQRDAPQAF